MKPLCFHIIYSKSMQKNVSLQNLKKNSFEIKYDDFLPFHFFLSLNVLIQTVDIFRCRRVISFSQTVETDRCE